MSALRVVVIMALILVFTTSEGLDSCADRTATACVHQS